MLAELGSILTGLALAAALYAVGAVVRSIRGGDDRWWTSGRNGIVSSATLLGLALTALLIAFLDDQFAIRYVADHSNRDLPLYLKVSAIWGGQEGSLLLWAFLQTLFAALVARQPSDDKHALIPWATVFLSIIAAFFVGLTLFLSNPFAASRIVPVDGRGLNPLLRHPGMVFHPPPMFVGYAGLAVPFALALAALITRRIDLWPDAARRWSLLAWLFLGLGLFLGMRWAYDVLGWGGYWGWDPVENGGLMPWITATAMLHGLTMQAEGRGYRWWNVTLAMLSFVLVLFGTFTTRSGLIQSVHAFARSRLGFYFLGAMGLTLIGSIAVFYSRRSVLSGPRASDGLLSRDGTYTLSMILLMTVTGSVFVGTLLPTLTEAFVGQRLEAGPAWFDRVTGPQFAAIVLLMGLCPLLGSAASAVRRLRRGALTPLVSGVIVTVGAALVGFTEPFSLVGFAVAGLAGGTALAEIGRALVGRRRRGANVLDSLTRLLSHHPRRYGGYLVHVGIVLMAVGVIGTRFYPFEGDAVLSAGESIELGGYALGYEELVRAPSGDRLTTRAIISVGQGGRHLGYLTPGVDEYPTAGQTLGTPAIRSGIGEDLYLVLGGWSDGGQQVTLRVMVKPLISFLWLGGLALMAGGTLALLPAPQVMDSRDAAARRRRLWHTAGLVSGCLVLAAAAWAMWRPAQAQLAPPVDGETGISGLAARAGRRPRAGDPAPDLTLDLLDGSALSLSDLRGQVVVVNFWSPTCQPCEEEIPDLQLVWEEYQRAGVVFVGVSFRELEAEVREMVSELEVSYPNGWDPAAPARYGVTAVPETFVIGPEGRVAYVHIGRVTADRLRAELDVLLAE